MSDEAKVLAAAQTAESLQAKSVAAEAEAKARKSEGEAAAEAVIDRLLSRMKTANTGFVFDDLQRAEIKNIVHEAMNEFFKTYSLRGKNAVLTVALLIGALVVIFGGLKSLLAWIGFHYIK